MELNRIYNENCLDTMKRMPDNFIDLTVTSPPYDNLRDYNGFVFPFEEIAVQLFRITKPGGVIVWVVGDSTLNGSESLTSCKQKIFFREQCGFNIHDTMIYAKRNTPPLNHNRYEQQFEYMIVLSKGTPKTFNPIKEKAIDAGKPISSTRRNGNNKDGLVKAHGWGKPIAEYKLHTNIFWYVVGSANDNSGEHPAVFPDKLAAEQIYSWSAEGDLVYDCFGGSGTTAKMAHTLNRNWILSEISKEYCQLAEKRLKPLVTQNKLF